MISSSDRLVIHNSLLFLRSRHYKKNMISRKKNLIAKSFNSVAKTVSDRNGDRISCVAKTLVTKSLVTEFHFGRYLATEIVGRKKIKFDLHISLLFCLGPIQQAKYSIMNSVVKR